jgi:hypothetical protein
MQTLKTAVVVVLFLTVLYGAYVAMNTPEQPLPGEMAALDEALRDIGGDIQVDIPELPPADPAEAIRESHQAGATAAASHGSAEGANSASLSDFPSVPGSSTPLSTADSSAMSNVAAGFSLPNPSANAASPMIRDSAVAPTTATRDTAGSDPNRGARGASPDALAGEALNDVELPPPLEGSPLSTDSAIGGERSAASVQQPTRALGAAGFENAIASADELVAKGQLREALASLSLFYGSPELSPAQSEQLLQRIDPLAGEVIYSKAHHLDASYRVSGNERLDEIAKKMDVPTQLLANINGVTDPDVLLPGTELKVIRGPFRAEVNLEQRELTLFLNDLYAGRFPIMIGNDPVPEEGEFQVLDKQSGRTYYGPGGRSIPVGDPTNPYGSVWLDLGRGVCIHGSPDNAGPAVPPGCIQLRPVDARDIFAILSAGSPVTIRR